MVFKGVLAPGSDHLESELAERLSLSRTPVREAMVMLEAQGLVEMRPRKGMRVLPISPDDMCEIYDILTELESLAAEKAARHRYGPQELAKLAGSIDLMDQALAREDRESWAAADDAFHAELVRLGGNRRMQGIVSIMVDQVRRAKAVTLYMRPAPVQSLNDHRQVLQAIAEGRAVDARRLHRVHREQAKTMLLDLLRQHRLHRL